MTNTAVKVDTLVRSTSEVYFKSELLNEFPASIEKIALLVTPEYEGIFKNGGIGTYYTTLSRKLSEEGWYVILLLYQTQEVFSGEAGTIAKQIFSVNAIDQVLELQPIHQIILSQFQEWEWLERESYSILFFTQAIGNLLPDAKLYVEFPDMCGLGYRTIQAKRSGILDDHCVTAVTMHSGHEWIYEVNQKYAIEHPNWFRQACNYEQYSFENADLAFFLSHFLRAKVEQYGWKTLHAIHLPYCFAIIPEQLEAEQTIPHPLLTTIPPNYTPIVFFGRLEERKGLCTFLQALQCIELALAAKIHLVLLGKVVPLYSNELQHLNSQQYIEQEIGNRVTYSIVSDLSSQDAIQLVSQLPQPIVCLTSPEENFPNSALEMGQLPVSLVVSDTGGFRETLGLIERSSGVRWFQPGNTDDLAQVLQQSIAAYPETPSKPKTAFLQYLNQQLLQYRLQYMARSEVQVQSPPRLQEHQTQEFQSWRLGMTSMVEQDYIYQYASQTYSGRGKIVDLGCWLGSSTIALAEGLESNPTISCKDKLIHAYDLFLWQPSYMDRFVKGTPLEGKFQQGDSFLNSYRELIQPWKNMIQVCPGDLTKTEWQGGEIEFLFVDAMKSWDLAKNIIEKFFPYLVPNLSLVHHQDFNDSWSCWIHLIMYRLREYFTPVCFALPAVIFKCVKRIPNDVLSRHCLSGIFSETFVREEIDAAFDYSLSLASAKIHPDIVAARVMSFVHAGDLGEAKAALEEARARFSPEVFQSSDLFVVEQRINP